MITIIAAVAEDGGIGRGGDLLWHLKGDLRHFKSLTMGAPVIMGRKTWESLPKRPLPGRLNIVVSRNENYQAPGAKVVASLIDAFSMAKGEDDVENKIFVIGGQSIYAEAMRHADALDLTEIHALANDADTFFPAIDKDCWKPTKREDAEENGITYSFVHYERIVPAESDALK